MDRDHARMAKPGGGPRFPHRTGKQFSMLLGYLGRQQDFLNRNVTVKNLVMSAPYPAHAAATDRLDQQIPATD